MCAFLVVHLVESEEVDTVALVLDAAVGVHARDLPLAPADGSPVEINCAADQLQARSAALLNCSCNAVGGAAIERPAGSTNVISSSSEPTSSSSSRVVISLRGSSSSLSGFTCYLNDHKVPPNETDQVQPIDRGLGRVVKLYMGQQMDGWLEDDNNMERWESTEKGKALTASDRRILLGNWYYTAVKKALEGDAKRKYFEHAGGLITADGTDDDLIKFEGVPKEYKVVVPAV